MFEEHLVCFTYSIVILSYTWIETEFWFSSLSYPDNPHILFSDFFNLSWYSDNLFTQCIKLPDRQSLLKPPTSLSRKVLFENIFGEDRSVDERHDRFIHEKGNISWNCYKKWTSSAIRLPQSNESEWIWRAFPWAKRKFYLFQWICSYTKLGKGICISKLAK